jgi:hypothetical protein
VGLSPVSVVSRCIRARSRTTLSVVRANRIMLDPDQAELGQCFSRLRSLAHRPGPSDPSKIDLAWPLRRRGLLPDAGCVGPIGLRARFSGRARPRPGRIRSSFRWTAPFETELPHLRFTLSPTRQREDLAVQIPVSVVQKSGNTALSLARRANQFVSGQQANGGCYPFLYTFLISAKHNL